MIEGYDAGGEMYRSRLFTVVTFAGVLAFGTAAAAQCGPTGSVSPPPSTTTTTSSTVPPVPGVDPTLTVGDLRIREGDVGQAVAPISVTLDRPATADFVLQYRISAGTATPAVDYASPQSGVMLGNTTVHAGQTSTSVSVVVFNDTVPEPDKTVAVDIVSAPGVVIGRGHGELTIVDNDVAPTGLRSGGAASAMLVSAAPTVSVGSPTVWEGDVGARTAVVPVTLSEPASAPVTVHLSSDGTLPDDWQNLNLNCQELNMLRVRPMTDTVTFATGEQSKQITVQVDGNVVPDAFNTSVPVTATIVAGNAVVDPPDSTDVVDDDPTTSNPATPPPPGQYRVSEPADGSDPTFPPAVADTSVGCGYPESSRASVSADGRYVLFTSNADNLIGNDLNGNDDVFVKDTWTGAIERVNVAADGSQPDDGTHDYSWAWAQSISANGRYVTFWSGETNLVPGDDNDFPDAFVKDRVTGAIVRLGNVHTNHDNSTAAFIGGDNRSVVFVSDAPIDGSCHGINNSGGGLCANQVYLYDVVTGTYTFVSAGVDSANNPVISSDGKHVAFLGWVGTSAQVYVKDLDTGQLEMVSVNNAGQPLTGVYGTYSLNRPTISADGQIVAFAGQYCNAGLPSTFCGDGTVGYTNEIWVRNRTAGTLTVGSVDPAGQPVVDSLQEATLSADGRYLAYTGASYNIGPSSIWLRDLVAGTTERVNTDLDGDSETSPMLWSPQAMTPDASSIVYTASHASVPVSATNPESVYITRRN